MLNQPENKTYTAGELNTHRALPHSWSGRDCGATFKDAHYAEHVGESCLAAPHTLLMVH